MSMSNSDELSALFEQPLVHKPGEPPPPKTSKEEDLDRESPL